MTRISRIILAPAALIAAPALAQTPRLPAGRLAPIVGPVTCAPGSTCPADTLSVTPDATAPAGTLSRLILSALPAGRKAVEQGDASDLKARPTDALVSRVLSDRFRDSLNVIDDLASALDGSAAINGAIAKAAARGGGQVVVPNLGARYTLSAKIVLRPQVHLLGLGRPTLMLANGVNDTVVETLNFQTLSGGSANATAPAGISIRGFILDGNRANNAAPAANAGHCLALYARDFVVEDLLAQNCHRRGFSMEYGPGGSSPYNGAARRLTTSVTGEEGIYNRVSDLHADDWNVRFAGQNADATFDGIYLPPGGGIRGTNINAWTDYNSVNKPRYSLHVSASAATIANMHIETGSVANVMVDGEKSELNGLYSYFNGPNSIASVIVSGANNTIRGQADPLGGNAAAKGLILGQSGVTTTGSRIDMRVSGFSGGVLDLTNATGENKVTVVGFLNSGTTVVGAPKTTDTVDINVSGAAGITLSSKSMNTLAAAGTTQADAAAIVRSIVRATSSSVSAGLRLPAMWPGSDVRVYNVSATAFLLYPPDGRAFYNVATNSPITVAAGGSVLVTELNGVLGVMRGQ